MNPLNGKAKISLYAFSAFVAGTIASGGVLYGIRSAEIGRIEGAAMERERLRADVDRSLEWIADYEKNVRPLRDKFIAFTGEWPSFRDGVNMRLDRIDRRLDETRIGGRGGVLPSAAAALD